MDEQIVEKRKRGRPRKNPLEPQKEKSVKFQKSPRIKRVKKPKPPKYLAVDWTKLVSGDKIKVSGGPYWESKEGEKVSIGHPGDFVVKSIDETGIHAYPIDNYGGHTYLYMGPDCPGVVGIKTAHRIVLINPERTRLHER